MKYEVIVGNVGTIYAGDDRDEATRLFDSYVQDSKDNYGRGGGESVFLMEDDDIAQEYIGALAQED